MFLAGHNAGGGRVGDVAQSDQPGRPGRPRDPSLEPRVVAAALAVYAENGWSGFNFEAVARRAARQGPALPALVVQGGPAAGRVQRAYQGRHDPRLRESPRRPGRVHLQAARRRGPARTASASSAPAPGGRRHSGAARNILQPRSSARMSRGPGLAEQGPQAGPTCPPDPRPTCCSLTACTGRSAHQGPAEHAGQTRPAVRSRRSGTPSPSSTSSSARWRSLLAPLRLPLTGASSIPRPGLLQTPIVSNSVRKSVEGRVSRYMARRGGEPSGGVAMDLGQDTSAEMYRRMFRSQSLRMAAIREDEVRPDPRGPARLGGPGGVDRRLVHGLARGRLMVGNATESARAPDRQGRAHGPAVRRAHGQGHQHRLRAGRLHAPCPTAASAAWARPASWARACRSPPAPRWGRSCRATTG